MIDLIFLSVSLPIIVIVSIQLIHGKWLMLIAGYNTLGKKEREKINGANLGKLVGSYLLLSSGLLLFSSLNFISISFCLIVILFSFILVVIIGNTSNFFKN